MLRPCIAFISFLLLLSCGCSSEKAGAALYLPETQHHFVISEKGSAYRENLILTVGNDKVSYSKKLKQRGFSFPFGSSSIPALWEFKVCPSDSLPLFVEESLKDTGTSFKLHYPQTDHLDFTHHLAPMYFDSGMPPGVKLISTSQVFRGMNSRKLDENFSERTYRGRKTLRLSDTTYTDVHKVESTTTTGYGTISHNYYFHDEQGFIFSKIILPDNRVIFVTRI